ncbi:CPBP family intramembrane glutamic endopeptidase [Lysinimonas soli]|uniref:CPBP family intramembrane glutamic endopeptidase n=1 Tax=Lysinimonas soli TaxID=1074233 RepID=A0ABW0NNI1_9MICO
MTAAGALPPLRYPRLLHALPGYRWWKPLVAFVAAAFLWIAFQVVFAGAGVILELLRGGLRTDTPQHLIADVTRFLLIDAGNPLSLIVGLGGVATLLPAVLLAYRIVGLRPLSVLRSVAFRLRWGWMALCLVPALLITLIANGVGLFLLPLLEGGGVLVAPTVPLGSFLLCALIVVVLTPIQAAAEEFAFRGLVLQMFGSWIRPVLITIPLAAVLFAAAHTQYIGWATVDVFVFALVAGYLTWRTGGIEAGIALHAANNTIAFLTLASSITGTTRNTGGAGDLLSLLVTIVTMAIYVLLVEWMARRRGIRIVLEPLAGNS